MQPRLRLSGHRTGLLLVIVADTIWSTVFVASQIALQYSNPYNVTFLRFLVAALAIGVLVVLFDKKIGVFKQMRNRWIWVLGIIYAVAFVLQYVGQNLTSAPETTLLTNLDPILIPPFAVALLKDRITKPQLVAMVLGLFGLILVTSPRIGGSQLELIGDVLLFTTSIAYTFFTVYTKKFGVSSVGGSFAIILIVALLAFPVALFLGGLGPSDFLIATAGWEAIIYLSIPCTVIAVALYLKGLSGVKASEAGFLFLIQILVGLTLSWLLLDQFFNLTQALGAAIIIVALSFGLSRK